jgi:anti-sigma factor RsiW
MDGFDDPVTNADFDGYVDDQLSPERRIAVEAYLSSRPGDATRVMADLRTKGELRLALAGFRGVPRPASTEAARRLERALARDRWLGGLQRVAAVGIFVAAGWLAHAGFGPLLISHVAASTQPPAYVRDAVMADRTTTMRESMASQPEARVYDPGEIRSATAIVMPGLPKDWRVKDIQIYPSEFGPSVEIAIEAGSLGSLSLFAVRPGSFDVVKPSVVTTGDAKAAYFQVGEVAYALVTTADNRDIGSAAERLAETLY